jgi:hypothetical protein
MIEIVNRKRNGDFLHAYKCMVFTHSHTRKNSSMDRLALKIML